MNTPDYPRACLLGLSLGLLVLIVHAMVWEPDPVDVWAMAVQAVDSQHNNNKDEE